MSKGAEKKHSSFDFNHTDDLVSISKHKFQKQQLHLTEGQDFLKKKNKREKKKEKHFFTGYSEICETTGDFCVCLDSLRDTDL